ncbi:phosphoserine phosphatase SerB [Idiomarina sp.]|jgi:phosphoserine phosphatase|uniref:phosphoserine phosphatase SerB n=1 Tax=Idiomarina sp. TaxID=1874361 RepID=UPI0035110712
MLNHSGLIVFDMDSTLISIECIDEIANLLGQRDAVAAITEQAMRGEIDFAASLTQRVALLEGIDVSLFNRLFTPIPFTQGAQALIDYCKSKHWYCVVVSGGFTWFTGRVAEQLGLDMHVANELEIHNGKLTGKVSGAIVDGHKKAQVLQNLKQQLPANAPVVAVGDGANDQWMLQAADLGVAFCAKPVLQEVADVSVSQPDLALIINELKGRF